MFVFHCITLLSMIISRSIHVTANVIISSFLWLSNITLCNHIFIHSSVDEHVVTFMSWLLQTVLEWTSGCTYLFKLWFSPDRCQGVGLLDQMLILFWVFWGISILFSIVVALIYIPTNSVRGFPFLHTLSSIYCL